MTASMRAQLVGARKDLATGWKGAPEHAMGSVEVILYILQVYCQHSSRKAEEM